MMMKDLIMLTLLVKHAHGTMRIVQGGHMCAGYNDDPTETAGKVYYGECQSADTAISSGNPFFTAEVTGMGLLEGTDTDYLTSPSSVLQLSVTDTPFKEAAVRSDADGNTFAYTSITAGVGDGKYVGAAGENGAGAYLGSAFYLVQTGSFSSSTNRFPAAGQESTHETEVCISEITDGVCGAERTWGAGSLKFTLYGAIGGDTVADSISGKSYLAFRTRVQFLQNAGTTVTFNDGEVAIEDLDGADVTKFTVTKGSNSVEHVFPATYNVGSSSDCAAANANNVYVCSTAAGNSFTRAIKIKATASGNAVNLDYLFAVAPSAAGVNDGLEQSGRYFVYDPDVTPSEFAEPAPGPAAPSAAATHSGVAAMLLLASGGAALLQ